MDVDNDTASRLPILYEEMEFDDVLCSMIMDTSSDEEEESFSKVKKEKSPNKKRDFAAAYHQVVKNYFNGRESVYSEEDFERRFRVPRTVFNVINDRLMGTHPFIQYTDATKKKGIFPLVKLVGCFRYLAYGDAFDREDENLHMSGSTLRDIVKVFTKLIVKEFGPFYLNRFPTMEERNNISKVMERRGFPGCLASWDCKHFNWKNCPMRLAGQHQGHSEGGKKTLILEAIADHRKYFWAANFGDARSLNDLNVLDKSSIVGAMLSGDLRIDVEP
jgi:Plant transposon protein